MEWIFYSCINVYEVLEELSLNTMPGIAWQFHLVVVRVKLSDISLSPFKTLCLIPNTTQ